MHHAVKMRRGRILDLSSRLSEWSAFHRREGATATHFIGRCVGPMSRLDVMWTY